MPNVSGDQHHKRLQSNCPNGHTLAGENLRLAKDKRWSKRKSEFVYSTIRQCRICWRKVKKRAMRKRRKASYKQEQKMKAEANLLFRIRNSRSLELLPTLIRAFGCQTVVGLRHVYQQPELLKLLVEYELDADHVSQCENLAQARAYLTRKSYFTVVKKQNVDESGGLF